MAICQYTIGDALAARASIESRSKASDERAGCFTFGAMLLILTVATMFIGGHLATLKMRGDAVRHGAAEYDSQTGVWRWKPQADPEAKE